MRRRTAGRTSRHVTTTTVTLVSSLLFVMGLQEGASANNNDMIDPDNVDHYVDRNSLTGNGDDATLRGIAQLNRTKMNATVNGSGDVEVFDAYYGTSGSWYNVRGRATCVNKTWTGLECDVYEVMYDQSFAVAVLGELAARGMPRVRSHRRHLASGFEQRLQ